MAKCIISACRSLEELYHLRAAPMFTLIELAQRASDYTGEFRVTYSWMTKKCRISRSTAIRYVKLFVKLGILEVKTVWRPDNHWAPSKYRFLLHWERPPLIPAHTSYGVSLNTKFPRTQDLKKGDNPFELVQDPKHQAKWGSLQGREKVIGWLTPGSRAWQAAHTALS